MTCTRITSRRAESGQAAVEAALTLPLVVFMVLGSLQLFMMLQARILAQVAIFRAVRAGTLNHGDCLAMRHAAIATLLPTLGLTDPGNTRNALNADNVTEAARLFGLRRTNTYRDGRPRHEGQIVELYRESPLASSLLDSETEDDRFDQWDGGLTQDPQTHRLEARMLYWYRLRIPFADWVMGKMYLAHFDLQSFTAADPLMPAQPNARWRENNPLSLTTEPWPGGSPANNLRRWASNGAYLIPIRVATAMPMRVPPRRRHFTLPSGAPRQGCPL